MQKAVVKTLWCVSLGEDLPRAVPLLRYNDDNRTTTALSGRGRDVFFEPV